MSFGAMTGPVDMTFPSGSSNPISISGNKITIGGPIRLHRKNDPSTELFLISLIEILVSEDDVGRRFATLFYTMKQAADNTKGGTIQFDFRLKTTDGTIDAIKTEISGQMNEGQNLSSNPHLLI